MTNLKRLKKTIKKMNSMEIAEEIYKLLDNSAFMNCRACPARTQCRAGKEDSVTITCRFGCPREIAVYLEKRRGESNEEV